MPDVRQWRCSVTGEVLDVVLLCMGIVIGGITISWMVIVEVVDATVVDSVLFVEEYGSKPYSQSSDQSTGTNIVFSSSSRHSTGFS